jgi:hypothetical protein
MRKQQVNMRERGIAMVMVLGMLAVFTVMTMHVVVLSQVTAREAKVLEVRARFKYVAESAASRAFWMLLADRQQHPGDHRNLLQAPAFRENGEDENVWRADGRVHEVKVGDDVARVQLQDAATGLDLSSNKIVSELRAYLKNDDPDAVADDPQLQEDKSRFLDVLADYLDTNDFTSLNGKERDGYEAEGQLSMPRNGTLQFREELLWLEKVAECFFPSGNTAPDLQMFRIVPPDPEKFPATSSKPSLLSSNATIIRQRLNLTAAELADVLAARQAYLQENIALSDSLDPALYARLVGSFSVGESGIVSIEVSAVDALTGITRQFRMVCDARTAALRKRLNGKPKLVLWESQTL